MNTTEMVVPSSLPVITSVLQYLLPFLLLVGLADAIHGCLFDLLYRAFRWIEA